MFALHAIHQFTSKTGLPSLFQKERKKTNKTKTLYKSSAKTSRRTLHTNLKSNPTITTAIRSISNVDLWTKNLSFATFLALLCRLSSLKMLLKQVDQLTICGGLVFISFPSGSEWFESKQIIIFQSVYFNACTTQNLNPKRKQTLPQYRGSGNTARELQSCDMSVSWSGWRRTW